MNSHYNEDMVGGFQKRQAPSRPGKSRDEQSRGRKFNKPQRRDKSSS